MRDEVDLFRRRGYHVNIRLEQVAVCAKNPIRVAEVTESLKLAK